MKCVNIMLYVCSYSIITVLSGANVYTISHSCDVESACFTINELNNSSLMDEVFLEFHPGRHVLSKPEFIIFEHIREVRITGSPWNSTEVACTNSSGFRFLSVGDVLISSISFLNCGSPMQHDAAVFLYLVPNFLMRNINVVNSTGIGLYISEAHGVTQIYDSMISGSPVANVVCEWTSGNISDSRISFTVQNLTVKHGGSLESQKNLFSGGMNIILCNSEKTGNILLDDLNVFNNSGHTGGNLRINISQCSSPKNDSLNISLSNSFIGHGKALQGAGLSYTGRPSSDCDQSLNDYNAHFTLFQVHSSSIINNRATEKGGGIDLLVDSLTRVYFQNLTLSSNIVTTSRLVREQPEHSFVGGGLSFHLGGGYQFIENCPVLTIRQCKFEKNVARYGAGFYIMIDKNPNMVNSNTSRVLFKFETLECVGNSAYCGAGGVISSHDVFLPYGTLIHQILIMSSNFESNTASTQASGLLISYAGDLFEFELHNTSFSNNTITNWNDVSYGLPSTLSLHLVTSISLVNCTFYDNSGSGVSAVSSRIIMAGFLNFSHNTAATGSGISLMSSFLDIRTGAFIIFEQNKASQVGGAIYTNILEHSSCFYIISSNCTDVVFQFIDNVGILGGNVLYERSLSSCTRFNSSIPYTSHFHYISEVTPQNTSLTSSDPYQVCKCYQNGSGYDCSSRSLSLSVIIGSPVILSLIITDENGLLTPGFITSSMSNAPTPFYAGMTCVEAIYSSTTSDQLILVPQNYQHYNPATYKSLDISLSLLPCPPGFHILQAGRKCDCLPQFATNALLQCNVTDFTITRLSQLWIGFDENRNTSISATCPFNYCIPGKVELHHINDTSLCISGRSGILCGQCKDNLSLTLGFDSCTECSNNFVALFLVFGGLGMLLVIMITLLNLTITEGAVNGVVFCMAFLHLNRNNFFVQYSNSNIFVILISWMNLDFGFRVCFYNGLTPHAKTWLQFVFPIYLYAIEMIVSISSYKSSKLARITGASNSLKIISTIFLLGYMKMLRVVIAIISYADIHSNSQVKTVWLYDGNTEYHSGRHILLFVVAVLFLAFISVPYTTYLLLFQILHRYSRFPCQAKRDGIIDAHVGAFKEKCRFWLGLLLLTYTVLVILYYFTGGEKNVNLTALTVACPALLLLKIWCRGIYKNKILDYLESVLLFGVLIMSAVTLQLSNSNTGNVTTALYLMLTTIFIFIFIVVVYHLYHGKVYATICTDFFNCKNCLSKSRTQRDPWSNNYDKIHEDISLHSFETDYEDATNLITIKDTEESSSRFETDLVPNNWLPTVYPLPVYREDPDLLKCHDSTATTTQSSNSSEKSSISEVIKIRSSLLVVDKTEDDVEASLIPCPSSNTLRSQRLSIDVSGNRTYIIEDNSEDQNCQQISDEDSRSVTDTKVAEQCIPNMTTGLQRERMQKLTPRRDTENKNPSIHQHTGHKMAVTGLRSSSTSRYVHKKSFNTRMIRRPHLGTVCFKCDPSLPLLTKIKRFKVDKNGCTFSIKSHDITLHIPPSAIKEDDVSIMHMEVGVMLNGPFVFPPHVRPISPIVWICIRNKASLCKPIDISIPHFINKLDPSDVKNLGIQFMKASHHARTLEDGKKRFTFDRIGNDTTTKFTSQLGKLQTHHFCFLCIAAHESRALYERASYCLVRVDPVTWNPATRKQEIYFIVSYNMKTCLGCIDNQYGRRVESRVYFQFSCSDNSDPALSIKLSSSIPGPRWFLALEGNKQIPASKVDFWRLHDEGMDIENMTNNEMYPPRFKLVISGRNAMEPTVAKIMFTGSQDDLDTDILLEPDDHNSTISTTSGNFSGRSSGSSISQWSIPSIDSETVPVKGISPENWRSLKVEPDLPQLQNYFSRVAANWKIIGVQLKIKTHTLDNIEKRRRDILEKCTEVLTTWQKNAEPPFLWSTFIEVLTKEAISEHALAKEICDDILAKLDTYNFNY